MDFARFTSRMAVLLALGGLMAALVAGCAAPDREERIRTGTVFAVVQNTAGAPVAGARLRVVLASNPSVVLAEGITNSRGEVMLQVQQVLESLRLLVNAAGFTAANVPLPPFNGRDCISVEITLGVGTPGTIAPGGGVIVFPGGDITFPGGVVTSPTVFTVTNLIGTTLPADVPAGFLAAGVVSISPDVAFPLDDPATPANEGVRVSLDNPCCAAADVQLRRLVTNPTTGVPEWVVVENANIVVTADSIDFNVPRGGTYALLVAGTITVGTATEEGDPVVFPPIATVDRVSGLPRNTRIQQRELRGFVPPLTPVQQAIFATLLSAQLGFDVTGEERVVVPPGQGPGFVLQPLLRTVTLQVPSCGIDVRAQQKFYDVQPQELTPIETVPPHLQGHVQGGAFGD